MAGILCTKAELETAEQAGAIALPTAKDLGYEWDTPLLVSPGETAAQEKLEEFCDRYTQLAPIQAKTFFPSRQLGNTHNNALSSQFYKDCLL